MSVAEHFAPDGSLTINGGTPSVGRPAIAEAARSFMTAFPDLQVLMDDFVIGDEAIEYHWAIGCEDGDQRLDRVRQTVASLANARTLREPRKQMDEVLEAEDRTVPGHRKGDLLAGAANSHIATLVERHSRFLMLIAVEGKDTRSVTGALSRQIARLPEQLRSSLTWDRGMEMATTPASPSRPTFASTSVIRRAPGSTARTRTPTVCFASTSQRGPTSRASASPNRTRSRADSTHGRENARLQDSSRYPRHSVALTG